MPNKFKMMMEVLKLVIPLCYLALGFLLLTNLFSAMSRSRRVPFGIIIILYGLFRIYRVRGNLRGRE